MPTIDVECQNEECTNFIDVELEWESLIFGGIGYSVFVLNHSGWWVLAAFFLGSCAYSPLKWIHGKET